ncbi:Gfo/Idh/MocA family oxidoreductase [Streptomyces sp. CHD11]|uniref:Gfo/Idh/MocA family protein n=1 Tax=Streptomyces sp. CHD11 TaxID=2741325 RepID=UPI001BFCC1DA|nr:Gfo/Idh/MocA family oxidoreductase [Streptomyces sp. CHD11]MBT3155342.1 Gfo/Idh/MocA family oxidoreductase [Streptomyces sp. CHD11]
MTGLPAVVLGAGKSGAQLARALHAHPRVDLQAVVGGSSGSASELGRHLGVAAFNEPDEGWHVPSGGIVAVASPHERHVSQVLNGLAAGADVLVDKPVAIDGLGFERISAAAAASGRGVSCGMVQRCSPDMVRCRDYLRERGEQIHAVAVSQILRRESAYYAGWKGDPLVAGGGVLLNQAIHALDLALYLTGAVPLVARATLRSSRSIRVEDHVHAAIETDQGVLSLTAMTCAAAEESQVIRVFLPTETVLIVGSETPRWRRVTSSVEDAIAELAAKPVPFGPGHATWVNDAVRAWLSRTPALYECELELVRASHEVVYALYESAVQDGAAVSVASRGPSRRPVPGGAS